MTSYLIWVGAVVSIILCTICLVIASEYNSGYDLFGMLGTILFGCAALFCIISGTVCTIGPRVEKSNCIKFGVQSNREVKFVRYNYFTWECLTLAHDNRWVPINNVIAQPEKTAKKRKNGGIDTSTRDFATWFKLAHKMLDDDTGDHLTCENPNCVDTRPRAPIVAQVEEKFMCRHCFMAGWLLPVAINNGSTNNSDS
jgi:hypothetical protein